MSATITQEPIRIGQVEIHFISSTPALSMFEFVVPQGARVPAPHYHEAVEEVVYGLEGILTFTINGTAHELRPGESRVVPRGVEHHFINLHDETARCLTVQTPGSIGPEYYREVGAIVNAGGPPDPVKVREAMGRHGVIAVPPRGV